MKKILLGLTTTPHSDWKEKICEIDKYNIKELALFPTYLEIKEREELYRLLEKSSISSIPHIHIRDDMEDNELEYLIDRYQTKLLNTHSELEDLELIKKSKYAHMMYIENSGSIDDDFVEAVNLGSGICLDVSHYEDKLKIQNLACYVDLPKLLKKHKIGCCHISAINKKSEVWIHFRTGEKVVHYSNHFMEDLSELDYVKYYVKYLPEYVSIELENSFKDQLKAKEYLEKIINN